MQTLTLSHPHSEDISGPFQRTEQHIAARKGRFTTIRRAVFAHLLAAPKPLGAYELLESLESVGSRKPPTVYRALDWLIEQGVVVKLATTGRYMAVPPNTKTSDDKAEVLAFLICRKCGSTTAQPAGLPAAALTSLAERQGFSNVKPVIELLGDCAAHRT